MAKAECAEWAEDQELDGPEHDRGGHDYLRVLPGLREIGGIAIAVNGVGQNEAAEEQHLRRQKCPHGSGSLEFAAYD
jgi:hypothetical protein